MTTTALTATESKLLAKYAPTLLSAGVLILGGLTVLTSTPLTPATEWTFVALIVTTITTYVLPVLPQAQYEAVLKVGLEVAGVVASVAIPWFEQHQHLTLANALLFATAVVKAFLVHVGSTIRSDAKTIDAGTVTGSNVSSITFVPSAPVPDPSTPTTWNLAGGADDAAASADSDAPAAPDASTSSAPTDAAPAAPAEPDEPAAVPVAESAPEPEPAEQEAPAVAAEPDDGIDPAVVSEGFTSTGTTAGQDSASDSTSA